MPKLPLPVIELQHIDGVDFGDGRRCHLFVREGKLVFLDDCTHALAGQTVPMEPML